MFDSLAYRNDAATVFRRLIRSLPTRRGVLGVATCDKGLPAMMMALAGSHDLPCVLVPGGVTLLPVEGDDAGRVQTIGVRFVHGEISLEEAAELGCRACASPGGGCQFLGTAATSQVVGEALGMSLGHSALAPSGHPIWLDMARRSARALMALERRGITMRDILTDAALHNAMVTHAAFGGSTNLILHVPAIAHAAGLPRPTARDWTDINRRVPRIVDALPNGPRHHPTIQVFLAGGVPEVMLHLRRAGLLDTGALTVKRRHAWRAARRVGIVRTPPPPSRRAAARETVSNADDVIMAPDVAAARGLTSTVCFPVGNLAPEGAVIKSTAIDPSVLVADGVYRFTGPARVLRPSQRQWRPSRKGAIQAGDVLVLICRGPMGPGMEETYQLTSALRYLPFGKHVAILTDARFSGVSTGACIGHVSPEALAGGPIGKLRDGDLDSDRRRPGQAGRLGGSDRRERRARRSSMPARRILASRRGAIGSRTPIPLLPDDTRLWAALQDVSGGTWGGCVFDVDAIVKALAAGRRALEG